MPSAAAVARVLNLVARRKLLSGGSALRLDGSDHEGPVEFRLDPFAAQRRHTDRLRRTPSASLGVHVESVLVSISGG